jgi:hypothetical protein
MVTALPTSGASWIDEGAGVPDAGLAWAWLEQGRALPPVTVAVPASRGDAAYHLGAAPAQQAFTLTLEPGASPFPVYFRSDAEWLVPPAASTLAGGANRVEIGIRPALVRAPGAYTGVVSAWTADTAAGPVARMITTVVVPLPVGDTVVGPVSLAMGGLRRWFFTAEADRPFLVGITTDRPFETALTSLHEPGGMPWREENGRPAGAGADAARYHVDARDVRAGTWELDAVAPPGDAASVQFFISRSPVRLHATLTGGALTASFTNAVDTAVRIAPGAALLGAERAALAGGVGSGVVQVPVPIPGWANRAVVDVTMDPEQWARFTDLGATLLAADGTQLLHQPLNYHLGRLALEVGDTLTAEARSATLSLLPGLADSDDRSPWNVTVSVRFYAPEPVFLEPATAGDIPIGPGGAATARFDLPEAPWPLPSGGFEQLAVVWAAVADVIWTREVRLGATGGLP